MQAGDGAHTRPTTDYWQHLLEGWPGGVAPTPPYRFDYPSAPAGWTRAAPAAAGAAGWGSRGGVAHRQPGILRGRRRAGAAHGRSGTRYRGRRHRRPADSGADVRSAGGPATRAPALRAARLLAQVLVRRRAVGAGRLHHQPERRQAPLSRPQRPVTAGGQARLPGGRRDLHGILHPGRPSPACARGGPPCGGGSGHEADHPLGGAAGRGQPGAEGCGARRLRLPAVRPLQRRLDADRRHLPETP